MLIAQAVRVIVLTTISFLVALIITPFWYSFLKKHQVKKQIREQADTPVYHKFHEKKAGTPTAGGAIIWAAVLGLAFLFWLLTLLYDGPWKYLNFVNRAETYLPIAALLIAALLGLLDDWLGVLRIGGASGGGLKIRHKAILYLIVAGLGAWWFYFRLGWDVLSIPFLGSVVVGPWYIPIFIFNINNFRASTNI